MNFLRRETPMVNLRRREATGCTFRTGRRFCSRGRTPQALSCPTLLWRRMVQRPARKRVISLKVEKCRNRVAVQTEQST